MKKENNNDSQLISVDMSRMLKGILAILIILHHSSLVFDFEISDLICHFFEYIGFLLTGIFFILSGYGVRKQLEIKGENYFNNFWKVRLKKIIIPYLILSACCYVLRLLTGGYGINVFVSKLISGDFPIPYSWYVVALLIEELLFYFCYRVLFFKLKRNKYLVMFLIFLLTVIVGFGYYIAGVGIWWYSSLLCFPVGILLEECEEMLISKLKWILLLNFIAYILLYIVSGYMEIILFRNIMSVLTGMFVVGIFFVLQFKLGFFVWLSKYSLEIYLIHGIVLFGIDSMFHDVSGEKLILAVIILSILGSVVWNFIYNYLCGKVLKGKNNVG